MIYSLDGMRALAEDPEEALTEEELVASPDAELEACAWARMASALRSQHLLICLSLPLVRGRGVSIRGSSRRPATAAALAFLRRGAEEPKTAGATTPRAGLRCRRLPLGGALNRTNPFPIIRNPDPGAATRGWIGCGRQGEAVTTATGSAAGAAGTGTTAGVGMEATGGKGASPGPPTSAAFPPLPYSREGRGSAWTAASEIGKSCNVRGKGLRSPAAGSLGGSRQLQKTAAT